MATGVGAHDGGDVTGASRTAPSDRASPAASRPPAPPGPPTIRHASPDASAQPPRRDRLPQDRGSAPPDVSPATRLCSSAEAGQIPAWGSPFVRASATRTSGTPPLWQSHICLNLDSAPPAVRPKAPMRHRDIMPMPVQPGPAPVGKRQTKVTSSSPASARL